MIFKLETPEHQRTAIQSVVEVFFKNPETHALKWRLVQVRL